MAVLAHLIGESPCVTVSLVCDGPGSQTPGMELAGETAGILLRLAAEAGVQAEQHVCRDPEAETPLGQMRRTLLAGPLERISGLEPWARAVRLESVRQECVFAGPGTGCDTGTWHWSAEIFPGMSRFCVRFWAATESPLILPVRKVSS